MSPTVEAYSERPTFFSCTLGLKRDPIKCMVQEKTNFWNMRPCDALLFKMINLQQNFQINEIDRIGGIGTTPFIPNLYQNHLPEHNPNNFNPTNSSRFHDESSPSNTIPNWQSTDQTNPPYSWMNGPYGSRPHHRKRHSTPEPQVSPMLPSIRPPSQPSTTNDYQKIAVKFIESKELCLQATNCRASSETVHVFYTFHTFS